MRLQPDRGRSALTALGRQHGAVRASGAINDLRNISPPDVIFLSPFFSSSRSQDHEKHKQNQ
jgi:hypothetical protein